MFRFYLLVGILASHGQFGSIHAMDAIEAALLPFWKSYPEPGRADPIIYPHAPRPDPVQDAPRILDDRALMAEPESLPNLDAEAFIRAYRQRCDLTDSELHLKNPFSDGGLLEYAKGQIERIDAALALEQHQPSRELYANTHLSAGDYTTALYGALTQFMGESRQFQNPSQYNWIFYDRLQRCLHQWFVRRKIDSDPRLQSLLNPWSTWFAVDSKIKSQAEAAVAFHSELSTQFKKHDPRIDDYLTIYIVKHLMEREPNALDWSVVGSWLHRSRHDAMEHQEKVIYMQHLVFEPMALEQWVSYEQPIGDIIHVADTGLALIEDTIVAAQQQLDQ
ncbi:hypothetical protein H4R35_001874 [Dimargaris xerosporica]|nr:hypothetical protein H4R35_001874 [Dimargaris xerosporica]